MKHLRTSIATLILVAALLTQPACGRHGGGLFAARLFTAILMTAAVATVLALHDAHTHNYSCGHEYVIVEERPVYHYQGRWEYYDPGSGQWYQYDRRPR